MTSASRRTVLVLGANGRFGLAAEQAFAAAGWTVLAQVRREAAPGMPPGTRLVRGTLAELPAALAGLPSPDVVVHGLNPIYTRWDEEALPLARAGMDLAERLGARFMLPGNVYNYGAGMPALIDEATPQRPTTAKGRLRAAMEVELEARAAAGRLRATVLTAGDFFGGGTGSWFDQAVVKSIAQGKLVYPGPLDTVHAWAYLPDFARAFVAAAEADPAGQPAFERFCFAGHAITGRTFLAATEAAAGSLGLRPARGWRRGGMPWPLLRVAGLFAPMLRELSRMSYLWRVPHALDGGKLAARHPQLVATPLVEALRESLAALLPNADNRDAWTESPQMRSSSASAPSAARSATT
ncbi:MAG: NAD-dependent epimerase/dehydratase family protein [Burkholderiales bacterium]|nr:NAD-dependent epimerase/dehydratase family protein [Burkholderiales bacterium]